MSASKIEWTEVTWNPVPGCDRISPGCDHCYAMTMARRLKAMGSAKYQNDGDPRTSGPGFAVTMHQESVLEPILKWSRKSQVVFLDSMSDVFHARVSADFHGQLFATMALTPQHSYQVLTKRPGPDARSAGRRRPSANGDDGCPVGSSPQQSNHADIEHPLAVRADRWGLPPGRSPMCGWEHPSNPMNMPGVLTICARRQRRCGSCPWNRYWGRCPDWI